MKPYAVSVTIGPKVTGKEFDTESEFKAFLQKAEELKKKAPQLIVKILRAGLPKPKNVPRETIKKDPAKEDCLAWTPVFRDGVPVLDPKGIQFYQTVPVPAKPNVFYCPYCHGYKKWGKVDYGYGLEVKGCPDCGISENDFHIKTANNLWRIKK